MDARFQSALVCWSLNNKRLLHEAQRHAILCLLFGVYQMAQEVCSPINRKRSDQPLSPGAKSNPSRARADAATARQASLSQSSS
jgi:hypothetical protein